MKPPTFYPLIHNEWIKTNRTINVKNPLDSSTVGTIYIADEDYLDLAIESAQKGFHISRELSSFNRYELLMNIAQGIKQHQEELCDIIVKESGKPIRFARNEITRAQLTFNWAAEESRRLNGQFIPLDVAPQTTGYYGIVRQFPLGVILGISPFNFPLNLVAHKIAPAIASGNSIILKPSSQTPITAIKLGEIIRTAGAPPGIVNILPAPGRIAEELMKDGRIHKLSFTGSAQIGWYLKSISGKKHVTLELGGNAGTIVEPDVEIDNIIPRLVLGSFAYAGQVCISIQRIFVHESIFHDFIKNFSIETEKSAQCGDPMDEDRIVGPMIDLHEAKRAEDWINEAVKSGAKIIVGGKRENSFVESTIITKTTPDMKVECEEVFAPVVTINHYNHFSEAIEMVNNSHYGLQAGVFTNDFRKIQEAYHKLEVGGVIINDYPTFRIDPMPYGGIKDSGLGREGIQYAINEMTELKLLAIKGEKI